jgi:hypothetical protein
MPKMGLIIGPIAPKPEKNKTEKAKDNYPLGIDIEPMRQDKRNRTERKGGHEKINTKHRIIGSPPYQRVRL